MIVTFGSLFEVLESAGIMAIFALKIPQFHSDVCISGVSKNAYFMDYDMYRKLGLISCFKAEYL